MSRNVVAELKGIPHSFSSLYAATPSLRESHPSWTTTSRSDHKGIWVGLNARQASKGINGLAVLNFDNSSATTPKLVSVAHLRNGATDGFGCGDHFVVFGDTTGPNNDDQYVGTASLIDASNGSIVSTLFTSRNAFLYDGCALPDAWAGPLTALITSNDEGAVLVVSFDPQAPRIIDRWQAKAGPMSFLRWCGKRNCAFGVTNGDKAMVLVTRGSGAPSSPCVFANLGLWMGADTDGCSVVDVSDFSDDLISVILIRGKSHATTKPQLRAVTLRLVSADPSHPCVEVVSRVDLGDEKAWYFGVAIDAGSDVGCILRGDHSKAKGRFIQTFHPVQGTVDSAVTEVTASATLAPLLMTTSGGEAKAIFAGAQGTSLKDSQIETFVLPGSGGDVVSRSAKKHRSE